MLKSAPEMLKALAEVEAWEADFLADDSVWANGLPRFTQRHYDRWCEIQRRRREILERIRGEGASDE